MITPQNERIRAAAWLAARGKLPGLPREGYRCLAFVRVVIEAALQLRSHEMYDRWLVAGTSRRGGSEGERLANARANPWAADFESSVKRLDWGIPFHARQPGDLLFNYHAAEPYGHVAILLDRDTVLENIVHGLRPLSIHLEPAMALTPVEALSWTLAARVPQFVGEGRGPTDS